MTDREELVLASLLAGEGAAVACGRGRYRRNSWFYLGVIDALAGYAMFYVRDGVDPYARGYHVGSVYKSS